MKGVEVIVDVTFRDDKTKKIACWDTPSMGGDWVTIYPKTRTPMGREAIPAAAIKDISWDYKPTK